MFKNNKIKLTRKKVIFSIIFIFCVAIIGFTIVTNKYLGKINKVYIDKNDLNINQDPPQKETTMVQNNDIENIALFGTDETAGTLGRSDCIIIFTIDNKHNKLKLSSLIRDSYVIIPTKDKKDKLTHAYAFGGPQLALKTLNENFNLNLDKFVAVDFSSFPKIIDSIGGITLDITNDELPYVNYYINLLNNLTGTNCSYLSTSGIQQVNGTQALAYCRIRYTTGGDFERSHRDRTVINQLIQKSKTIPLTQYPSFLDELLPLIKTNLETSEILSLGVNLNFLKNQPIEQDRFPRDVDGNGQLINGIYYYVFDKESTTKNLHNFIFDNMG